MIQEVFSSLAPQLTTGLTDKFNLTSEEASGAISTTKDTLLSSLTRQFGYGDVNGILGMLNQGQNLSSNAVYTGFISNLTSSYSSKLGLSPEKSSMIANFVLPKIISAIKGSKSKDFDKTDLTKMLGSALGDGVKSSATDALKKGIGSFFK